MEDNTIKDQYIQYLAFSYGDKERLIKSLEESIALYTNCKHSSSKRAIDRIEKYRSIIDYAKNVVSGSFIRPMTKACKVCVSYDKRQYPFNELCKNCEATKGKDIELWKQNSCVDNDK